MSKLIKIFSWKTMIVAIMAVWCVCANAATDTTGCSDENNAYITPELALCSTHVHNVGATTNFEAGETREIMKDVVALKTTVMTQQMYKQYEYLESMVKRLKTQLEKAVLTTKLQVAGAEDTESSSSGTGGGFKSSDRNIFIAGVSNCNNELTKLKVFECLNNNLNSIYNASNNGSNTTIELRKQLANDYSVAKSSGGCTSVSAMTADGVQVEDCTNYKQFSQRKQFQACLDGLRSCIRNGYEDATYKQRIQDRNNDREK